MSLFLASASVITVLGRVENDANEGQTTFFSPRLPFVRISLPCPFLALIIARRTKRHEDGSRRTTDERLSLFVLSFLGFASCMLDLQPSIVGFG